jgi:uncharacterized protein
MNSESLLEFPCSFPIKAMGRNHDGFHADVVAIVSRHLGNSETPVVNSRPSKDGNYVSVTVTIEADSKDQLDSIYRDLSSHPDVLMTL